MTNELVFTGDVGAVVRMTYFSICDLITCVAAEDVAGYSITIYSEDCDLRSHFEACKISSIDGIALIS